MEYRLGLLDALNIGFNMGSFLGTAFLVLLLFILPIWLYCKIENRFFRGILTLTFIFLIKVSMFSLWGNGWTISEDQLHIKTYNSSDDINICRMKIGFVNLKSEWEPVWRENGAGTPIISAGLYRLKNGKRALVFNHYRQNTVLLISAEQKYYVIGHPDIEKLYNELLRLNAEAVDFTNNEVIK